MLLSLSGGCSSYGEEGARGDSTQRAKREIRVLAVTGETREVAHPFGVSQVPLAPKRVVTLGLEEELLLLGQRPVAASPFFGAFRDFLQTRLEGVAPIGTAYGSYQPDLEAIYAARPDLILATPYSAANYTELSAIAPTVVVRPSLPLVEWEFSLDSLRQVARVLGREARAERVERAFREKVAAARDLLAEHRSREESVATFRVLGRTYRMNGRPQGGGPILYDALGLHPPRLIRESHFAKNSSLLRLNEERMLDLDVDHLFVIVNATLGSDRTMASMEQRVVWQRLPAVREGHVYPISMGAWQGGRTLGQERVIDEVLWYLAGERLPELLEVVDAE